MHHLGFPIDLRIVSEHKTEGESEVIQHLPDVWLQRHLLKLGDVVPVVHRLTGRQLREIGSTRYQEDEKFRSGSGELMKARSWECKRGFEQHDRVVDRGEYAERWHFGRKD